MESYDRYGLSRKYVAYGFTFGIVAPAVGIALPKLDPVLVTLKTSFKSLHTTPLLTLNSELKEKDSRVLFLMNFSIFETQDFEEKLKLHSDFSHD